MKTGLISMLIMGLLGSGIGVTYAVDLMADKEASPTIQERLTKDTIEGTLMSIEGEYFAIKNTDGKVHKISGQAGYGSSQKKKVSPAFLRQFFS
jgi:hypothetical protein